MIVSLASLLGKQTLLHLFRHNTIWKHQFAKETANGLLQNYYQINKSIKKAQLQKCFIYIT